MKRFLLIAAAGVALAPPAWAQPVQTCSASWLGVLSCETKYPEAPSGNFTQMDGIRLPGIAVTPTSPVESATAGKYIEPSKDVDAEVWGADGAAVGNGARVGQYVPASAQVGTAPSCSGGGAVNVAGTGCTGGTNPVFTPASPNYKPAVVAHTIPTNKGTALGAGAVVEHNNSTAIGAGAKSTDKNQVTLGTKNETIRAEGITSQKSKDRQIGSLEVVTSDGGGRLATDGGAIYNQLGQHGAALDAHSAMLSEHATKLGEHEKGLAIAMAMPDAWLSDKKRFGIFGSVGGFGDETAIGLATIGRLDETWSINGKLGSDTGFEQFGWQVGFGAQW